MRTTKLVLLVALFAATVSSKAQVSVNVNIGTPPVWAPAAPVEVQYYYLPDIEVYYDVPARCYIYLRKGKWHRSAVLPARYRGYDLYHGHTVYLTDYHGRTPYVYYNEHRVKYVGNKGWKSNGHDNGNRGNGRGHGHGNGKGKGHGKH
ncbi:hypothetical protein EZL74_05030 [Flavobacterium silvisoli]|uniref:DUF3300 domain-containing protein n=1 Tax=Flavobacterium silvisoli TaxID=2529433 RepID=A0A4Q9Z1H7_9FLAO|nr:hypothetical protein [Flavobacterium silvisoli]TBX70110.1 hypothetical protein EZL74_05030 [Flavobacterium silvisoli]